MRATMGTTLTVACERARHFAPRLTIIARGAAAICCAGLLGACGETPATAAKALPASVVGGAVETSVVRGTVVEADPVTGDARGPVAGVVISVLRVYSDASARDTATAAKTYTPVGEVTSGRDGTFELKNVAAGYYALDAKPPQGSGLRAGRAWSISFSEKDPSRALVYLYH